MPNKENNCSAVKDIDFMVCGVQLAATQSISVIKVSGRKLGSSFIVNIKPI